MAENGDDPNRKTNSRLFMEAPCGGESFILRPAREPLDRAET
jgi:hypothetical protein